MLYAILILLLALGTVIIRFTFRYRLGHVLPKLISFLQGFVWVLPDSTIVDHMQK